MDENKEGAIQVTCGDLRFQQPEGKTLLEALEQSGVEIHYHCREGFCGACRTKLIAGQVEYTTDPLAFIDDDEILPCCCKPVTDVEIELE